MIIPIILLIIIYILNIIDYFQTIYAIKLFGIDVEVNPIGRLLLANNYAWIAKLIFVPTVLIIIGIIIKIDKKQIWVIYFLLIWFACVVAHNFIMLYQTGLL